MDSPPAKKQKSDVPVIGTHSGTFHCDEALACYMLKLLPEYSEAKIVRTRDLEVLKTCDIVVDVGAVYDPETHRYDHHQREFTETFSSDYTIKLSSAGLVYKHFGRRVVKQVLTSLIGADDRTEGYTPEPDAPLGARIFGPSGLTDDNIEYVYQKMYKNFILALDGGDNGVPRYPPDVSAKHEAYHVHTELPSRVSRLNPRWNSSDTDLDGRFLRAVEMTGVDFTNYLESVGLGWLPARSIVERALENRGNVHDSNRIIELPQFAPWKDHLIDLEEEQGLTGQILYCLFQDQSSAWRVGTLPVAKGSFVTRKSLPSEWCGLRDDDLSSKSGIPGCIFVHASGFIGGVKTREGALAMAIAGVESSDPENAPISKEDKKD